MPLSKEADALVRQLDNGIQKLAADIKNTEAKLAELRKKHAANTKQYATIVSQLEGYYGKE